MVKIITATNEQLTAQIQELIKEYLYWVTAKVNEDSDANLKHVTY